jgi:hypothetical protein
MSEPKKKDEKETEIQEIRSRCKSAIPEILPLMEGLPAEDADELAADLDQDVQAVKGRMKDAGK